MVKNLYYLESLGGPFIISSPAKKNLWLGSNDDKSSYDLLYDYYEQQNGAEVQIIDFKFDNSLSFLIFFSLSKNLKVFETATSLILCEQYYLSSSWNFDPEIKFDIISETDLYYDNIDETIVIFDATLAGEEVVRNEPGSHKSNDTMFFEDYLVLNLTIGKYRIRKVNYHLENIVSLKGVEFVLNNK